ncbi:uncharacterized protein F5Z01DRAFT_425738 [Emericellopsis atlantica]|uniref:Uncharacterized protein n=1 Tax=Emericellopsis atlantica TaxID=2614577 RepID=A0A9P8CKL7_9HYPO|nr:uncharacterized protein F5Z01DRAFT_425738 [Emericellopsis atlantica]KAG9250182.1 hypothetical protein F5Z01DRAFT_425738 [Emericellopsis atlantica]
MSSCHPFFTESTLSRSRLLPPSSKSTSWHTTSRRAHVPVLNPHGARSLVDMLIPLIARNVDLLTPGHITNLAPRLRWKIWRFLEARGASLHAWRLFHPVLLHDGDDDEDNDHDSEEVEGRTLGLWRFRGHVCRPEGVPLRTFMEPLAGDGFLTHLVISGRCTFTTSEMLPLAGMANLVALEIIQPSDQIQLEFPPINDMLIRGWASVDDAFPALRILRIWGDPTVTRHSLAWVTRFPSLVLYDVQASREDWSHASATAAEHSWDLTKGLEDGLHHYLMLLTDEAIETQQNRRVTRSIDSDLTSLLTSPQASIRFVAEGDAPILVEYLADAAKSGWESGETVASSDCHDWPFEAWAFWLMALMGQMSGPRGGRKAVAGPFVLPEQPMASVYLGHCSREGVSGRVAYVKRGLFGVRRYTFVRRSALYETGRSGGEDVQQQPPVQAEKKTPAEVRARKKRRMDDMLSSFT